jgi:hypothetical protein
MSILIICVAGAGQTGKSSAIRAFLDKKGRLQKRRGDVTLILPILNKGKRYSIGVASRGDSRLHVRDNFIFLAPHGSLRAIVCASRSKGKSFAEVKKYAGILGAGLEIIPTRKVGPRMQQLESARVVAEIVKKLP